MDNQQLKYFTDSLVDTPRALEILELNEALAEVIFGFERSGEPAHLDLDDEYLERLAQKVGHSLSEVQEILVSAVRGITKVPGPKAVFTEFAKATRRWENLKVTRQGSGLETPPALSLLAVLTMAAENMRRSGDDEEQAEGVRATNYYLRLSQLLGTEVWTPQETQKEYRKVAQEIWQSLKDWLDEWQDERGICTVTFPEVTGKPNWAVQMPISQALLRVADRENLHQLFKTRGLDPGIAVSREMMSLLLGEWCATYGTGHLKSLWKKPDYQEGLILAAQAALASWSGVSKDAKEPGSKGFTSKVGLTFEASFLTGRAEFGIEIRVADQKFPSFVDIQTESGDVFRTQVRPGGPRTVQVVDDGVFDPESLVTGMLRVTNQEVGLKGVRFPLPIAIFTASSFGRSYSEVSVVELGLRHGLLVRREMALGGNILKRVEDVLLKTARPGWKVLTSQVFEGLPDEWVFIENVEFVTFPAASDLRGHLEVLAPREIEKITFSDGFRIPGRRERWFVGCAPNALAVFPYECSVTLRVRDSFGTTLHEYPPSQRVAFAKLSDLNLSPGTYVVEAESENGRPLSSPLYLVAANTPNPLALETSRVVQHFISESLGFGVLSAQNVGSEGSDLPVVRGFNVSPLPASLNKVNADTSGLLPDSPKWKSGHDQKQGAKYQRVKIEKAPPESCVNSAHHWVLPPALDAKKAKDWPAECKFCKLTKVFPGRPRQKKEIVESERNRKMPLLSRKPLAEELVLNVPHIESLDTEMWDHAFAVMCYLRHGSINDLSQIALQVSSGSIGVDQVIKKLSTLGHIDVKLDEFCRPDSWSVSPPVLVMRSKTEGHLAGYRDVQMLETLEERVRGIGGDIRGIAVQGSPQVIDLSIPDSADAVQLVSGIVEDVGRMELCVLENGPAKLLGALPSIAAIGRDCPHIRQPSYRAINKWDGFSAQWIPSENGLPEGAYQNIGNGYTYTLNHRALSPGEETQSGTAAMVKHWESALRGVPLFFYNRENRELCTRLGAELPGLIARAVVGCSGRLPMDDTKNRIVKYTGVGEEIAQAVALLLSVEEKS